MYKDYVSKVVRHNYKPSWKAGKRKYLWLFHCVVCITLHAFINNIFGFRMLYINMDDVMHC